MKMLVRCASSRCRFGDGEDQGSAGAARPVKDRQGRVRHGRHRRQNRRLGILTTLIAPVPVAFLIGGIWLKYFGSAKGA